jgi:predicted phage-related endonuclease
MEWELIMVGKVTSNSMLSASRLPAIMGMSKYRSPNDELQVSIDAINGKAPPDITNEAMNWGNQLEPVILQETAERLKLTDLQTVHEQAYFHPTIPICCSLDGYADGGDQWIYHDPDNGIYVVGQPSIQLTGMGVVEAKLTGNMPEDEPPLWRGPVQLQSQMDIMDAQWGALATLYRGTELRIFLFAPHKGTQDRIAEVAKDFQNKLEIWRNEHRIEPYPMQDSKDGDRLYPFTNPDTAPVYLDDAVAEYAQLILKFKKKIEQIQTDMALAEKSIKEIMKDQSVAIAGKFEIKWPMRHYKAAPSKVTAAKEAYSIRQSTLSIKEI